MSENAELLSLISQWVEKAENDLTNAAHTLKLKQKCPADTVCFHAQQCVEKYIKVLLVMNTIPFSKTHDLEELVELLPEGLHIPLTPAHQTRLTKYATSMRYPGDYIPISLPEARDAVRLARGVRSAVRALLPKPALRRRKK